jgi:hypothetical protein
MSDENRSSQSTAPANRKRTYETPRLIAYGTVDQLTAGSGGGKNEPGPGNPSSRA